MGVSVDDVAAVRAVIDERVAAMRHRDAARVNAVLSEDIVVFELVPPLAITGEPARDIPATSAWFQTWNGPVEVEIRELKIVAEGNVAFAHALHRLSGERANGTRTSFWLRSTMCFGKRAGRWTIVHSHSSVPFHLTSGFPAALDLQP
jgi:ketosteroid isomerase-like protein